MLQQEKKQYLRLIYIDTISNFVTLIFVVQVLSEIFVTVRDSYTSYNIAYSSLSKLLSAISRNYSFHRKENFCKGAYVRNIISGAKVDACAVP